MCCCISGLPRAADLLPSSRLQILQYIKGRLAERTKGVSRNVPTTKATNSLHASLTLGEDVRVAAHRDAKGGENAEGGGKRCGMVGISVP